MSSSLSRLFSITCPALLPTYLIERLLPRLLLLRRQLLAELPRVLGRSCLCSHLCKPLVSAPASKSRGDIRMNANMARIFEEKKKKRKKEKKNDKRRMMRKNIPAQPQLPVSVPRQQPAKMAPPDRFHRRPAFAAVRLQPAGAATRAAAAPGWCPQLVQASRRHPDPTTTCRRCCPWRLPALDGDARRARRMRKKQVADSIGFLSGADGDGNLNDGGQVFGIGCYHFTSRRIGL